MQNIPNKFVSPEFHAFDSRIQSIILGNIPIFHTMFYLDCYESKFVFSQSESIGDWGISFWSMLKGNHLKFQFHERIAHIKIINKCYIFILICTDGRNRDEPPKGLRWDCLGITSVVTCFHQKLLAELRKKVHRASDIPKQKGQVSLFLVLNSPEHLEWAGSWQLAWPAIL